MEQDEAERRAMISREELHRLVWTEPASSLAGRLGVSASYLVRVCTALDVPRPPQGYWLTLAARRPPPPELPPLRPGSPDRWSRDRSDQVCIKPFYKLYAAASPRHAHGGGPHVLVAAARPHFESAASRAADIDDYIDLPKRLSVLDVTASVRGLPAVLDLADRLYRTLEARGHRVIIAGSFEPFGRLAVDRDAVLFGRPRASREERARRRPTVVYVGSTPIGIAVVETAKETVLRYAGYGRFVTEKEWKNQPRVGYSWSTVRWSPTGLVKVVAYSPFPSVSWRQEWSESRSGQLARRLGQIAADLEEVARRIGDWRGAAAGKGDGNSR
ncbi:hypothetical protein CN151_32390 [Sinorhizobium meliloti]|uniref:hypothetical protein n=1 Tax=Rhizobium meliloti TaxID=382 RepID=UPI000FD305AD|nr:hypothetical protein [Sinorhizobium meliloti]RVK92420.1 hypothetical protein CN151_32390 [Sinorhizobium meliloti]RVM84337.1 hypothetical protein CN119_32410 [Sinorhizobium meliloti]RVM99922.1 hypothetical protein CN112_34065 [Sinorhizobium meliloti]